MPSAVRDAKHSNAERSTGRARDTCTTHTHNAAVHNTTGRIQHCMSTVSTATRCVHSRAFCLKLHSTHHFLVVRHVGVLVRRLLAFPCAVLPVRCWSSWPLDCAALRSRFLPWLTRTVHSTRVECFSTDVAWHCSGELRLPALVFDHA